MLAEGLLDFVFGVKGAYKGPWTVAFLYDEPLLFIPRGATWKGRMSTSSVQLKDIADETYVMVPDACGLSRATRALFRSQRRKLREYAGEAMSYQVLEQWAALGIGAAILPRSKVTAPDNAPLAITDGSGQEVTIGFEATWSGASAHSPHLREFVKHLRQVVPGIVGEIGSRPNAFAGS
jgi:DNA-binding transcriptional LysR family regulator